MDPVPVIAKGEGSQDSKYPDEKLEQEHVAPIGKLLAETNDSKVVDEVHRYFGEKLGGGKWNCEYLNGLTSKNLFNLMAKSSLLKGRIFQCAKTLKPEVLDELVSSKLNTTDLDRLLRGILINPTRSYSSRAVTHVFNGDELPTPDSSVLVIPSPKSAMRFLEISKISKLPQWELANLRFVGLAAGIESDALERLLKVLERNRKLEMLDIAHAELTETALKALKEVMEHNPITHLRLRSVLVQDTAGVALSPVFAAKPSPSAQS